MLVIYATLALYLLVFLCIIGIQFLVFSNWLFLDCDWVSRPALQNKTNEKDTLNATCYSISFFLPFGSFMWNAHFWQCRSRRKKNASSGENLESSSAGTFPSSCNMKIKTFKNWNFSWNDQLMLCCNKMNTISHPITKLFCVSNFLHEYWLGYKIRVGVVYWIVKSIPRMI